MGEKMTLADALSKAHPYTVMHGKSGQYPDGSGWGHAWNEEGMWLPREAWSVIRAHLTQPAQAVDVERILAALGHVCVPNTRCLARVAETPKDKRPPGPQNPPMWCCLQEGHDGPHRHNGGGMYPSIPFRDTDEVVMGDPLPGHCKRCNRIWPCDDAKAITAALPNANGKEGES